MTMQYRTHLLTKFLWIGWNFAAIQQLSFCILNISYAFTFEGHLEPGEVELETALRETKEEAGLRDDQLTLYENFKRELNYDVNGRPKRVVYWLAQLKDPNSAIILSDEHTEYKWLPLNEENELRQYADMYGLYREAEQFISENNLWNFGCCLTYCNSVAMYTSIHGIKVEIHWLPY